MPSPRQYSWHFIPTHPLSIICVLRFIYDSMPNCAYHTHTHYPPCTFIQYLRTPLVDVLKLQNWSAYADNNSHNETFFLFFSFLFVAVCVCAYSTKCVSNRFHISRTNCALLSEQTKLNQTHCATQFRTLSNIYLLPSCRCGGIGIQKSNETLYSASAMFYTAIHRFHIWVFQQRAKTTIMQ